MQSSLFVILCAALLFSACDPKAGTPSAKTPALLKQKTLYKTIASTQAIGKYQYEYDKDGRLTKVIDNGTSSTSSFSYYTLSYNTDGTIDKRQVYVSDAQQTNGYKLANTFTYSYQSGHLVHISGDKGLYQLFDYAANLLRKRSILNADGTEITDYIEYEYDQVGTLTKKSHTAVGLGMIDYTLYNYSNGKLASLALNTKGVDSTIIYEYKGAIVSKITYLDQYKEIRRQQIFSFNDNGDIALEIFNDFPKMGQDSTHITKYEYYP